MTTKTVDLRDTLTVDTFNTLVSGFSEEIEFLGTRELSENGIELTKRQMVRLLENIVYSVKYSVIRGHGCVPNLFNISYGDNKYFTFERRDNSIHANDLHVKLDNFDTYKFYVSENNWIDLYFERADGSGYVTMVILP